MGIEINNIEFKSSFTQEEVYSQIIDTFKDDEIKNIIEENKAVRLQCKAYNVKSYNYNRVEAIKNISKLCKKVKSVKESINKVWNIDRKIKQKKLETIKTEEEFKNFYIKEKANINVLKSITIYWASKNDELNELGDKLYKKYKNGEFVVNEQCETQEDETVKSEVPIDSNTNATNDILSMNFGQVVERFLKYEQKVAELQGKIDEKTQETQQLKETIKSILDYKNLKKDINNVNKNINGSIEYIKKENDTLKKELKIIDNKNNDLKDLLAKQLKIIESLNNDKLAKQISSLMLDLQNTIKSSLIEDNKKNVLDIKQYIDTKLQINFEDLKNNNEFNNSTNETKNINVNPRNNLKAIPHTKEEKGIQINKEIDDIDAILDGLKL